MEHSMIDQTPSLSTASQYSSCPSRQIVLDIYYTSILRDPQLMNNQPDVMKKQILLYEDSFILCHKETYKIKVTNNRRDAFLMINEGFDLVTQVKFRPTENGKSAFSIQKNPDLGFALDDSNEYQKLLIPENKIDLNSLVFYSVKNERQNSSSNEIRDKDLVKFGKQIYKARIYPKEMQKVKIGKLLSSNQKIHIQEQVANSECKICLMSQGQHTKDYIVSPCKCSGSCQTVHVECLKSWIAQKIQVGKGKGHSKLHTYDMNKFTCEICKQNYPQTIKIQQSFVEITPEVNIQKDTLILSKIFPEDAQKISHFVGLEKGKELTIGRHYLNQLILEDMSVSRNQASIYRHENERFYLYDKNSRFGTFISLKNPISNLSEAIILTFKQTFRFKLIDQDSEKNFEPSSQEREEITEQRIDINY